MKQAQVRIILEIGDDDRTWVSVVPVVRSYPTRTYGVVLAAAQAAAHLTTSVMKEAEIIAERLAMLEVDA